MRPWSIINQGYGRWHQRYRNEHRAPLGRSGNLFPDEGEACCAGATAASRASRYAVLRSLDTLGLRLQHGPAILMLRPKATPPPSSHVPSAFTRLLHLESQQYAAHWQSCPPAVGICAPRAAWYVPFISLVSPCYVPVLLQGDTRTPSPAARTESSIPTPSIACGLSPAQAWTFSDHTRPAYVVSHQTVCGQKPATYVRA